MHSGGWKSPKRPTARPRTRSDFADYAEQLVALGADQDLDYVRVVAVIERRRVRRKRLIAVGTFRHRATLAERYPPALAATKIATTVQIKESAAMIVAPIVSLSIRPSRFSVRA